jgi:hypothetical protein
VTISVTPEARAELHLLSLQLGSRLRRRVGLSETVGIATTIANWQADECFLNAATDWASEESALRAASNAG